MAFNNSKQLPKIPDALIWGQCIAFVLLYGIWAIYELLYFRRILLISGAILALYPIYQYRTYYFQKRALPLWLFLGLFLWATFHLIYLAQDYPAQLLEFRRIWKYAGLAAIFAFGFGLSLSSLRDKQISSYWTLIYFGLSLPVLIYLVKYVLTIYGPALGISPPVFLRINLNGNSAFYIPKTDYIAFCLPVLALSLGQIYTLFTASVRLRAVQYLILLVYSTNIAAILFLFSIQNTKNGIAYAAILIALFLALMLLKECSGKLRLKAFFIAMVATTFALGFLYPHLQKNDSWSTLIADTKIGFAIEQYPHWMYAGERGYPINEYGKTVSVTNYERASWFKVGLQLAVEQPMGYGLVEDSFKRMVKAKWPQASSNLSHSHSGWLDLALGIGFPGILFILTALLVCMKQSRDSVEPWKSLIFWALLANLLLWLTTEVAATVSFSVLIFWISLAFGLTVSPKLGNEFKRAFG